jgi:beta-N-acetylhexosaminidase
MSVDQGQKLALAIARLGAAVVLLPYALDWRSPLLASVRAWALAAFIVLAVGLIVGEIRALRGADASRRVHALNGLSLALAVLSLTSVLSFEAQFQWKRYEVLRADAGQLEKLGRHIVVGYRDGAELKALIDRRAIAGVFLTTRNVRDRDAAAIKRDVAAMQDARRQQGLPSLLIATDQEGGGVSRLSPPLTWLQPLSEIVARHSDPAGRRKALQDYAATQARELADVGVNVNFAPVVDLAHGVVNPDDRLTRIGMRAISKDPHVVADVAEIYCSQLAANGVRCTLKHFPGLGRVFEDTHLRTADLASPPSELAATDWVPFRSLMQRPGVLVMLSHARLTAVDRDRPVSFSRSVVGDLLRTDWGYDGVLITDDFSMGAVYRSPEGIAGGSVEALNAGVDLILISFDVDQFYVVMHALIQADRAGKLRDDALRQSNRRFGRALAAK